MLLCRDQPVDLQVCGLGPLLSERSRSMPSEPCSRAQPPSQRLQESLAPVLKAESARG
jgi:hypothetical protein